MNTSTIETAVSHGSDLAIYIGIAAVVVTIIVIIGGLNFFAFLRKNKKEFNEMKEEWLKEALEKKALQGKLNKLDSWTGNQQADIDKLNEGVVLLAVSVNALIDHAIEKQEGNGKCHDAQKELDKYLRDKALNKKSHN